jgi:hypothetical protein
MINFWETRPYMVCSCQASDPKSNNFPHNFQHYDCGDGRDMTAPRQAESLA